MSPWFQSTDPLLSLGEPMRTLTLGSMAALTEMGLTWLDEAAQLDLVEEQRQIGLFHWLHTAAIGEVEHALWSGDWRVIQGVEIPDTIIAHYRLHRTRLMRQIKAASIVVRPKPDEKKHAAEVPSDVVAPSIVSYRLFLLMRDTHMSRHEILWELPLVQALELCHCSLWNSGRWTVRPGEPVDEAEFADFELAAHADIDTGHEA